jgi:hypothetical protein
MDPAKVLSGRTGKPHLSYSSLSKFRAAPNVWALNYLMGVKDDAGPGAWRGTAVEAGLDQYLFGQPDKAGPAMIDAFEERAGGVIDDETQKEREALPLFLAQARLATEKMPTPLTRQSPISIDIPWLDIPLVGYTDYRWADKGLDLKTTWRMPTEAKPDHIEQMSIYRKATGLPFSLLYVTPKKWSLHEVQESPEALDSVYRAAHALVHAIRKADDPQDFLRMYAPDFSSFYWSPTLIEAYRSAV